MTRDEFEDKLWEYVELECLHGVKIDDRNSYLSDCRRSDRHCDTPKGCLILSETRKFLWQIIEEAAKDAIKKFSTNSKILNELKDALIGAVPSIEVFPSDISKIGKIFQPENDED